MTPLPPLPWQDGLWSQLAGARRAGRLAHALLFMGPAGVGKRRFTRALGAALVCESPQPLLLTACGDCRGCLQFASDTHPNFFWLAPEVDEKTGKEKRDIGVDQLRALGEKLVLSSHYGGPKIVVFDPADALNISGVNALLKTVEEPPPATHLILISERPMALAATLRSRCQRLRFAVPPRDQALGWLASEQPDLPPDALDACGGAPLRALEEHRSGLLQQQALWRRELFDVADRKRSPLAAAAAVGRERNQAGAWLSGLMRLLADVLRAQLLPLPAPADAAGLAGRLTPGAIQQIADEALEAQRRLQSNAQAQLVIESLMIAWWRWTAIPAKRAAAVNPGATDR